jgi:AhpD family alkylhydroperoxidase
MVQFPVYTIDSAPDASKPALRDLQAAFGMIPNIAGVMATSPVLINSLVGLFGRVHGGSFTEAQIQTLLLTNAVTNACTWAVAFHSALALREGLDPADVEAIRAGRSPSDGTYGALSTLARTLIEKRGRIDDQDAERFLAAGFGKDHLLERGIERYMVGMSTMVRKPRIAARKAASKPAPDAKTSSATKKSVRAHAGGKVVVKKAAAKASSYILSAPKGARTLTHREIKQVVEKVFKERYGTDA